MAKDWQEYQEEAAAFFRNLGLKAETDVTLIGTRTKHDIDVVVDLEVAGFVVRWLVECKHWATPVTKLHVMGLRTIVTELGADRGIILCEAGFQSGAVEAANLTNVQVTSLRDLSTSSREAISSYRLREIFDRVENCRQQYWDIPKTVRIDAGLRPEVGASGYSGARVIDFVSKYVAIAMRGKYPIEIDAYDTFMVREGLPKSLPDTTSAFDTLEHLVSELERKLVEAHS